ncbi:hypothetical protein [Acetobacter fabarum]|uniref:hypothetical protein n=1 Tax=Acetobacter fabarum TaxID=483199 RepID=UPI0033B8BB2D
MIQSVSYADVVRLHRTDAVCVGLRAGLPLLCFLVPEAENTRHRADVPLSWCESAQANLPPEVRVRCVVRERAVRGPVVGQLPQPAMQRIHAMIARERTSQTVEGGCVRWRWSSCACMCAMWCAARLCMVWALAWAIYGLACVVCP